MACALVGLGHPGEMKTWIAITALTVGLLVSMLARDEIAAFLTPKPKTLLTAVELGSGARRSIATYPTEEECLRVEQNLNVIAEENGRTERSACVAPVHVETSGSPKATAAGLH